MIRPTLSLLLAFLLALSLAAVGYWMLFSSFAVYDDEGYILLSVREYFAHGHLYEGVYSQYGPAFYVLLDLVQHTLGAPIDHTTGRLLTLGFWLGTGGFCAAMVWRHTAALGLTLCTFAATFLYLYFVTDEPFHPGSLIFFLIALSLWATTGLISSGRLTGAAIVSGSTGAILALTKINVGAFYLVALAAWAMLQTGSAPRSRWVKPATIAVLAGFAVALMHGLIGQPWIQIYLALFVIGAVTLVLALKDRTPLTARTAVWFLAAGAILGLILPGLVWIRGTSPAGLLEGILLGPLRHPSSYSFPVDWRTGTLPVGVISLGLALAHPWVCRRFSDRAADRMIVVLRWLLGAALLLAFALILHQRVIGTVFSYVAPLLWIWIIPLRTVKPSASSQAAPGLIAMVLLLQYLHAYPVGGSQESWGTFLIFPLAAIGLGDTHGWFATGASGSSRWWPALASVCLIVVVGKICWVVALVHKEYAAQGELQLPGAEGLHLPESQRTTYRILTLNAAVYSDRLFSAPGLLSFNLWTGLPAPTGKNTTLWFALLSDSDQQAIIQAMEQWPRTGIIFQESLLQLLPAQGIFPKGILWDYLQKNFHSAFRTDGFAYWIRNNQSIAPLNIAEYRRRADSTPAGDLPDTQIEFCLAHDGRPIQTIELRTAAKSSATPLLLDGKNTLGSFVTVNRAGQATSAAAPLTWPLTLKGLIRLSLRFNLPETNPLSAKAVLYLHGVGGEDLGQVRIGE